MPFSVSSAFTQFRSETVDLDPDVTKTARSSRDYLYDQIKGLSSKDSTVPKVFDKIDFGSFARNSKIRPLDDIDMMAQISGIGTDLRDLNVTGDPYVRFLKITSNDSPLYPFRDQYDFVNSTSVLNKFRDALAANVTNYKQAEIKKTMQAVTLSLKSYDWVFDIVPAVAVEEGIKYYIIPNGRGNWTRTDPRVDARSITETNKAHDGEFLKLLRLLKYWNKRTNKPVLKSYYFETLAIRTFRFASKYATLGEGVKYFFQFCPTHLSSTCPDPKGLGPNLDAGIDSDTKQKVIAAMQKACSLAQEARLYEALNQAEKAIGKWRELFGDKFPKYG